VWGPQGWEGYAKKEMGKTEARGAAGQLTLVKEGAKSKRGDIQGENLKGVWGKGIGHGRPPGGMEEEDREEIDLALRQ